MSRQNQWFVRGDGISREVITADIQRYLGPDALVRPGNGTGEYEGQPGYWITAYRTLTSQMIADLRLDSQRWQQERAPGEAGRGVAYQDSQTHASRQHFGPTETFNTASRAQPRQSYSSQQYATSEHYTTTPTPGYGASSHQAYQVPPTAHAQPRTQPVDPYANYGAQPGARDHPGYATPAYSYPPQSPADAYGRQPAAPATHAGYAATPRYFGYSDERFLVYR
ncbi:hypothetical protein BDV95DRAFT_503049 [Massariosphaeria phaeospora]|uniref:Transcription factor RfeG n=1 Tax=Massariosphaeria phaeospora TaxID=100035 RepID=A0A7C8I411_9PLEO|nr:hypothetical protein BDV95DRAFT_503049 [Massariosphaeria phaeospora]